MVPLSGGSYCHHQLATVAQNSGLKGKKPPVRANFGPHVIQLCVYNLYTVYTLCIYNLYIKGVSG